MFSSLLLRSTSLTTRFPRRAAMSSSALAATQGSQSDPNTPTNSTNKPALLPSPSDGATTTTLDVSGEGSTVKLDHLGPLVVNTNGTMSRIGNWAQMSSIEKENTLRILGKRNKQRLEVLKKKAEENSGVTGL